MKRIQLFLSLTGSVCALTGALMLLASFPMLSTGQAATLAPQVDVVYIGTDGCYTCHIDANSLWTDAIEPRLIDDAVINPQAVVLNPVQSPSALPIGAADDTLSYRVTPYHMSLLAGYEFGSGTSGSPSVPKSKP